MPARHTPDQRIAAFWAKAEPEPNSGCWLWIGAKDGCGYGMITLGTKNKVTMHAQRMAWILTRNPGLVKERYVLHTCRNPACVNPSHLYEGTQKENTRDQIHDGTHHFSKWAYTGKGHKTPERRS